MAINLYQPFSNPVTGETFTCLAYDERAYVMEWTVQPGGYIPFEHIHLQQDEIFHIQEGEIRLIIDGKTHIGEKGQTLVVKKGQRHLALNNQPKQLKCVVEYTPGFDHYRFFQCFAGLVLDGDYDRKGQINIPKMIYFSRQLKTQCLTRPTSVPAPVFGLVSWFFGQSGTVLGWEKLLRKYTEET